MANRYFRIFMHHPGHMNPEHTHIDAGGFENFLNSPGRYQVVLRRSPKNAVRGVAPTLTVTSDKLASLLRASDRKFTIQVFNEKGQALWIGFSQLRDFLSIGYVAEEDPVEEPEPATEEEPEPVEEEPEEQPEESVEEEPVEEREAEAVVETETDIDIATPEPNPEPPKPTKPKAKAKPNPKTVTQKLKDKEYASCTVAQLREEAEKRSFTDFEITKKADFVQLLQDDDAGKYG